MSTTALSKDWLLIWFFALAKLLIHFFTFSNFELHRDAYLYYAQSEHLAWGYVAVPPFVAVTGKLATFIFGNSTFGLRFFPALIGAINLIIIGLAVKELGGRKKAIILACLAYILSPSYMHVNALFQPVAFNHFFWLLCCYLILIMVKRNNPKIWIWIGVAFGFAFLNKYSIVFLISAFAISLLISRCRYLFMSKYFAMALVIGLVIILPNLIWQYQHSWPVLQHMSELRETQLVHVRTTDFITDQFFMNIQGLLLWLPALGFLLFFKKGAQYRIFGLIYVFVMALLMLGSGKSYYTLGVYPILFVFGAFIVEKFIKKYVIYIFGFLVISMFGCFYASLSFDGIPITTFEKAVSKDAFRWEDGEYHDIPQDMADMTGWKAIGESVTDLYLSLGESNKNNCDIFCNHYGQAGAVMFYGKKFGVPQPISTNGSFIFWAPDSISGDHAIWVDYDLGIETDSYLSQYFEKVELKTVIDDPYFRENGTRIYLCSRPKEGAKSYYRTQMAEFKNRYRRP